MMKQIRKIILGFFFTSLMGLASSQAETWKILTLDWPPYTDQKLTGNGAAAQALAKSLKSVGVDVEFVFMPWTRAAYEVRKPEYVGIFPAWTSKNFKGAKLSPPLFHSPIGFVYPRSQPRSWKTLMDFKGLRIGTVHDYQYPEELIQLGEKGIFKLMPVNTDEQNLFRVAYKRVDLTVVDLENARYLMDSRYPDLKDQVIIDPKVYKNADLFIALKNDSDFQERFQKLKRGLQKVPQQKIIEAAIKETRK